MSRIVIDIVTSNLKYSASVGSYLGQSVLCQMQEKVSGPANLRPAERIVHHSSKSFYCAM
jgi:hypothetical protein